MQKNKKNKIEKKSIKLKGVFFCTFVEILVRPNFENVEFCIPAVFLIMTNRKKTCRYISWSSDLRIPEAIGNARSFAACTTVDL